MARIRPPRPLTDEQKAVVAASEYSKGFAKPPRERQFLLGESGNPSGRPRGARSMRTLLDEMLENPVTISVKGVQRQVSAKEAVLNRLLMMALTGKAQDADLLVRLIKHALPEQFAEEASDELSVEEADLMEQVVNKAIKAREQARKDKADGDPT